MRYRLLGNTGLKVSELCLGAMTFGNRFFTVAHVDQAGANQMTARALESGINFFDTADVYSFGQSEEFLGNAIRACGARRDAVIIATKVRAPASQEAWDRTGDLNNIGLTRHHILSGCEASLKRLGVDYIDLYQVHGEDVITPVEESLRALDDLVQQGKVRYLGCSNWTVRRLMKALCLADARQWTRFVSLQAYYSLVGRDLEHELLPLCREEGLGVLPWSPLSGGFLTGKYRQNAEGRRVGFEFPPVDARGDEALSVVEAIAKEKGASMAQISLAWLLAQPGVTSIIIGATKMAQLEDNLKCPDIILSDGEMARLSEVTKPPQLYPQWMVERQNLGR